MYSLDNRTNRYSGGWKHIDRLSFFRFRRRSLCPDVRFFCTQSTYYWRHGHWYFLTYANCIKRQSVHSNKIFRRKLYAVSIGNVNTSSIESASSMTIRRRSMPRAVPLHCGNPSSITVNSRLLRGSQGCPRARRRSRFF